MNTKYSLHVVHPAFELLKRSAKVLHFIAAAAILLNAWHEWQLHNESLVVCITQAILGVDILLLIFFTGNLLLESPKLNLIFRFIETLVLFGISISLFFNGHIGLGLLHLVAAFGYFILLHREARVLKNEDVEIKATGIVIPNLVKDVEISWADIKTIIPKYHSVIIETLKNKRIEFDLRRNLKIDELQQINDFCSKHLING
ncbi:MAG: hypothetical protein IPP48_11775 [Chitinophagaceae bacterium]|nr:hypothetical protein [Chitinophagaceae bacterium]